MIRWLLSLSVVYSHAAAAAPLHVESRTLELSSDALKNRSAGPGGTIEMPWVSSRDSRLAARINESLYLEILEAAPPRSPGKTFSLPRGLVLETTHALSFVTARNDERVLAIDISREACGAYCEGEEREFSFHARTGRALYLRELVTAQGMKQLGKAMTAERKRRYAAELQSLEKAKAAHASPRPGRPSTPAEAADTEEDDLEACIVLNKECLEREKQESVALDPELSIRWAHLFLPKSGALVLVSARCSNHAMRALDDVGEVALTVPPHELAPLLSTYGREVLLGRGSGTEKSIWGQVLHGFIGKSPVTVRLEVSDSDGSTSGLYYYDKYRKPIELHGRRDGVHLELTEDTSTSQASFDLSVRADGLVGRWRESDREAPVTLGW